MSMGRVLSSAAAVVAVAGGAVVVLGLTSTDHRPSATAHSQPLVSRVTVPATKYFADDGTPTAPGATAASVGATRTAQPSTPRSTEPHTTLPRTTAPASKPAHSTVASSTPPVRRAAVTQHVVTGSTPVQHTRAARPKPAAATRGQSLPLHYSTGNATKIVTVTAHSRGSTTATVQAWKKASGGGWTKVGSAIKAYIGSQGMTTSPSESKSATPMGSFTLTRAFGALSNPGSGLPYSRTNSRYYWMSTTYGSQAKKYNTMQICPASNSGCYDNGINERLYYETPYYNYAVVIDYNTRNAPGGVHVGKGSAFFFHVSTGRPTAGCVAIPQSRLVPIMRWLTPSAHPRMLIGTA